MKKLVLLFALFAFLFSCSKKESDIKDLTPKKNNNPSVATTGEVQFQPQMIDLVNGNVNARLEAANAATILVTIEDDKGVIVKNKASIKLTNFNGSYISQPLVLKDGIYKLKEFLVLDAASNVLYATPLTGSALASVVTTPLPMTFSVTNQTLSTVNPQVVSTLTKTAANFGYLTFNFAVVETLDFNLAVFAFNKNTVAYDLITSDVTLKNGTTEMYKGTFPANIEAISIKDEKAGTYTLTVAKTGYKTYIGTYTYADLKAGFDDPINVILEEATKPLAIGDSYQGGIIAYILQAGDPGYDAKVPHGIIAAPSDQSTGARWGCWGNAIIGADGQVIGTGAQNTLDIVDGCIDLGIAAKLCNDLVLGGYFDWYLPSIDELNKLYENRVAIGSFVSDYYWSSTEVSLVDAWILNFNNRDQAAAYKSSIVYVRAVRAF